MEKEEAVSKNKEIVTHFNNYFSDVTKGLNMKKWYISNELSGDPLVNAIWKYEIDSKIIKSNHLPKQHNYLILIL